MNKTRVVFMGTPDFAVPCLDILVKEGYEIVAVVTQPDRPRGRGQKVTFSPVKEAALMHGLEILQPKKIREPEALESLMALQPDIMVVVAYGQILPKTLLDLPKWGCINVHASLLPKYRGAAPIHWAIMEGETLSGVTTMHMDVGMDTGDMILREELSIDPDMTTGELHDALQAMGAKLLSKTLCLLLDGKAPRLPQGENATYASMLKRDMERLDWTLSAQQLHNRVRGLNPWPGAYTTFQNKNLKVWRTKQIDSALTELGGQPGEVLAMTENGFWLATGQGVLELLEVQPESKRRMTAKEFATGYQVKPGMILA
ncbi:methionyl-tRNA formyltransferase [Azotosporobacter soli]|uniref:methionyl-tRNA formyltransferase n=1 Tax=Azotosporobacter soli TaxID=3055040 RepID=UPI0031FF38D6